MTYLIALMFLSQAQNPQPLPTDPARFNTEIVVTPERGETPRSLVPASTVVIDAASLQALPVVHPSEVVSFLPGFSAARPQFYAGRPVVSARGFFGGGEAEYILLLVDGVPIADVESGLIDWSVIPASSIRRIEAFRGPGAALYGDSAVGGVIQILTNRPAGGELTATGGSFRTFTADGTYGRRSPHVGFKLSGAARRTDGGFEHSGGQQVVGGGSLEGEHAFAGTHSPMVRFGLDVSREQLDTSYRSVSAGGDIGALNSETAGHRFRAGVFASSSWDPIPRVRLSGALRWDNADDEGFGSSSTPSTTKRAWSPRAGVVFQLTDSGSIALFAQV